LTSLADLGRPGERNGSSAPVFEQWSNPLPLVRAGFDRIIFSVYSLLVDSFHQSEKLGPVFAF